MSYVFDTVQRALSAVRDADNLTERQKDLVSFSQDVIDRMHTHNHGLKDAVNHDHDCSVGARYLQIVVEEPDKQKQLQKMNEYNG